MLLKSNNSCLVGFRPRTSKLAASLGASRRYRTFLAAGCHRNSCYGRYILSDMNNDVAKKSPEDRYAQQILSLTSVATADAEDQDESPPPLPSEVEVPLFVEDGNVSRGGEWNDRDSVANLTSSTTLPQALAELIEEHRVSSLPDNELLRRLEQISESLILLGERQYEVATMQISAGGSGDNTQGLRRESLSSLTGSSSRATTAMMDPPGLTASQSLAAGRQSMSNIPDPPASVKDLLIQDAREKLEAIAERDARGSSAMNQQPGAVHVSGPVPATLPANDDRIKSEASRSAARVEVSSNEAHVTAREAIESSSMQEEEERWRDDEAETLRLAIEISEEQERLEKERLLRSILRVEASDKVEKERLLRSILRVEASDKEQQRLEEERLLKTYPAR